MCVGGSERFRELLLSLCTFCVRESVYVLFCMWTNLMCLQGILSEIVEIAWLFDLLPMVSYQMLPGICIRFHCVNT